MMKPVTTQAVLLMESRSLATNVRSGGPTVSWSRLYRGQGYLFDLSIRRDRGGSILEGQVLDGAGLEPRAPRSIRLAGDAQQTVVQSDDHGFFSVRLGHDGPFSLTADFPDEVVEIDGLEVA